MGKKGMNRALGMDRELRKQIAIQRQQGKIGGLTPGMIKAMRRRMRSVRVSQIPRWW